LSFGGVKTARLLLVGVPEETHVGAQLLAVAGGLGLTADLMDSREAWSGPRTVVRFHWHLRGHRPARLNQFSRKVVEHCRRFQPQWILTTGLAPVTGPALAEIGSYGVKRLTFLTDDPWIPKQRSSWFLRALGQYDRVYSPRRANLTDLEELGCRTVRYLPFGYSPAVHFPQAPPPAERDRYAAELLFVGGPDAERVKILSLLIRAGFQVALYGWRWERYASTRGAARGVADAATLRQATSAAKVTLGLVRRANRDGHSMRSFEVPAMQGCLLAEDTADHREIFGAEGETVLYFARDEEIPGKLRTLLHDPDLRSRLASGAYTRITSGENTYRHRLQAMLA
jgi:spore maturation protein CgeB